MIFARLKKVLHSDGKYALEGQTYRDVPANTMLILRKENGSFGSKTDLDSYVLIELGERKINTSEQTVLSFCD